MVVMIVGTACGEPAEPAGQNGSDVPAVEIESLLNRQGRYLTFITPDGLKIDELKYTAASGTFYEYGGIAYNPLTAKEKEKVDEILGIQRLLFWTNLKGRVQILPFSCLETFWNESVR